MSDLVRIMNTAQVARSIIKDGTQLTIDGSQELVVTKELAAAFLDKHNDIVKVNLGGVFEPNTQENRMWVANMTGDPDAPMKVQKKGWKKGHWEPVMVDNPKRAARTLKYTCETGMQEYTGKSGVLEALNLAPAVYRIPAYARIEVEESIGRWLCMMDGANEPENRRTVIKSRRPSSFEPDSSWPLDDLRIYLKCLDANAPTGKSEEDIRKGVLSRKGTGKNSLPNTKEQANKEVFEAVELLLKRTHFRLVDPQYTVPTMGEFNELKRGPRAEVVEDPDALLESAQENTESASAVA